MSLHLYRYNVHVHRTRAYQNSEALLVKVTVINIPAFIVVFDPWAEFTTAAFCRRYATLLLCTYATQECREWRVMAAIIVALSSRRDATTGLIADCRHLPLCKMSLYKRITREHIDQDHFCLLKIVHRKVQNHTVPHCESQWQTFTSCPAKNYKGEPSSQNGTSCK